MKRYIKSSTQSKWSDWWRPYKGSQSSFQTYYDGNGDEIGYVEMYDDDGSTYYMAFRSDAGGDDELLGEFEGLNDAKSAVERIVTSSIKCTEDWEKRMPSRYWEPEDERTEEEMYQDWLDNNDDEDEPPIPFSNDYMIPYDVTWTSKYGGLNCEAIFIPEGEDVYSYIEDYLSQTYPDEYSKINNYHKTKNYVRSSVSEEEQLNQAILDGRPFDLKTFTKYKVDPYRAEGAIRACDIKIGDFVKVTEDASEVNYGDIVEIVDIDYDDPEGLNFDSEPFGVITFICNDEKGRPLNYNLHFWPDEYVGPVIGHQAKLDPKDIEGATTINRYSDVRPYEDRKYWYFTTHGIGPGTIPNDLNVLEVREGQNDKGTWGDFICLDGVLNTSELEKYDLRELAPSDDITSSVDIEDEWSPFSKGTYRVDGKSGQTKWTNNPITAIKYWFQMQKDAPSDVAISCETTDQAVRLVQAATPSLLEKLNSHYDQPYEINYLIDESAKQVENSCRGFYENKYGYGDTVHPFGVG